MTLNHKKPNILFLHYGGEWLRGSEYSLLSIMSGLKNDGYNCSLLANNAIFVEAAQRNNIIADKSEFPYVMIDPGDKSYRLLGTINLIYKLVRIIRRQKIDLVYCNSALPAQSGYFAARITKTPIIVHIRAPYIKRYIHLYNINRCDTTIFVSNATKDYHLKRSKIVNPVTIYNGVPETRNSGEPINLSPPPDLPSRNSLRLCQIGAIIKQKGIDTVINAIKILKQEGIFPVFYFVGRGDDLRHYQTLVEKLALDEQIFFLGEIKDIPSFLQEYIDINVLASIWEEPFGRVIIEGYFAQKPIIGSNVGGIPEIIDHNKTGLLLLKVMRKNLQTILNILTPTER